MAELSQFNGQRSRNTYLNFVFLAELIKRLFLFSHPNSINKLLCPFWKKLFVLSKIAKSDDLRQKDRASYTHSQLVSWLLLHYQLVDRGWLAGSAARSSFHFLPLFGSCSDFSTPDLPNADRPGWFSSACIRLGAAAAFVGTNWSFSCLLLYPEWNM